MRLRFAILLRFEVAGCIEKRIVLSLLVPDKKLEEDETRMMYLTFNPYAVPPDDERYEKMAYVRLVSWNKVVILLNLLYGPTILFLPAATRPHVRIPRPL